ncbi:TGF_BETA_2 domain-containing protein [Caerostris darwini]|uniref:TGF_BETA_2 domain-containing protein n=1 Tax=Caerostris darwini TaxID=1538125 RepID=A0AAV4U1L8_9ARAC|nr:TGF_BETA_2 domain-containing protein [Caerostris darwini]
MNRHTFLSNANVQRSPIQQLSGSKVDTDGEESPFLVVTQHTEIVEPKKRVARSSNENCTCCAENYHITLQDIGWQQWVLSPTEFDIKVCRGQCNESLSYFTINYQRIINSFYKVNKHLQRPGCNTWTPRCKAETYKELRMLYLGKDGTVFDQVISNMIIDSCKCM